MLASRDGHGAGAGSGEPVATTLWCHSHFLLPTGGTKYVYEVARRLARRRPVEMVVERSSDYWRERYAAAGVPLHEISAKTSTSKTYWLAFPRHLRHDRRELTRIADDTGAGHFVSSFFPFNLLCGELAAARGVRHTHLCFEPFPFFHDSEVQQQYPFHQRALMRMLGALYGRLDTRGVCSADELLTLNEVTRKSIARTYGRDDATPVFTGIDHDHFHPFAKAELADLLAHFGDGPIAVHSTDFSPIKRTDLALAAFAEAAVAGSKLLVTSTIDDRAGIERMFEQARRLGIEQQVEYLGFVDYDDLPRFYALADVLLQTGTSLNSGATSMSLPVKEGLACGTAVIRSRATDEDVEDAVSGFLVNPEDSAATGERLAQLLTDRDKAARFGAAGHVRMLDLYRWDRVTDAFEATIAGNGAPR